MVPAPLRCGPLKLAPADHSWLLERESCANALHNLDCASGVDMWLVERARPGTRCPRFERCVWQTVDGGRLTWSGTVPAGPPTPDFLDGVLAGMRAAAAEGLVPVRRRAPDPSVGMR